MDRRTFLSLGLVAPFALKSGFVWAKTEYKPVENVIETSFSEDPASPKGTLWQIPRQQPSQMMGYVYRADNGQTVVFDGGWDKEAPYLVDLIIRECDGKVYDWFLTHAHFDHCGAIGEIITRMPDAIKIGAVYRNFPELNWLLEYEKSSWAARIFDELNNYKGEIRAPNVDEVFQFGSTSIRCLNEYDLSLTMNCINNSSICFRIDVGGKSILILGDLGREAGDRLAKLQGKEALDCDFVQMAHHGQQGVNREFYELVDPSVCLWPTPDWLWENNQGGKGPNTGPWKTLETRAWIEEMGITQNFVSKDGLVKLTF